MIWSVGSLQCTARIVPTPQLQLSVSLLVTNSTLVAGARVKFRLVRTLVSFSGGFSGVSSSAPAGRSVRGKVFVD